LNYWFDKVPVQHYTLLNHATLKADDNCLTS
jgi:hypothetical protein